MPSEDGLPTDTEMPSAHASDEGRGRRIARNTAVYLAGQVVSWAVTLATISVIPRRLGEVAWGQYSLPLANVALIAAVLSLSIESYLTAEIGRDRRNAERLLRATLGLRLVSMPVLVAVTAASLLLNRVPESVWWIGLALAAATCVGLVYQPMRAAMVGLEEARRVTLLDLIVVAHPLAAIPFLAAGPIAIAIAFGASSLVVVFLQARFLGRIFRLLPTFNAASWRLLALGGTPFLANSLIVQLYSWTTVQALYYLSGDAAVGAYTQSQRIFSSFLFVPTALGTALLPSLARLAASDENEFKAIQRRVFVLMVTLGLPVAVLAFVLAEPVCRLLYGPRAFTDVPGALQVCALNVIPVYITSVMYQFLIAQRKTARWTVFLAATVALNAVGCFLLIPLGERLLGNAPAGAQAASLLAELVTVPFALILLRANPFTGATLFRLSRALLAAAIMAGVVWYTRSLFVVVPALLGLATFGAAGWLLHVLEPEEEARLASLARRFLRR